MTNTSPKTDVRQILTEDIDAQIAELRAKRKRLGDAGRALVAAADDVDTRKAAVAEAEKTFQQRRQDLIDLGLKPRAITRLLAELRAAPDDGGGDGTEQDSARREERSAEPAGAGVDSGTGEGSQQPSEEH